RADLVGRGDRAFVDDDVDAGRQGREPDVAHGDDRVDGVGAGDVERHDGVGGVEDALVLHVLAEVVEPLHLPVLLLHLGDGAVDVGRVAGAVGVVADVGDVVGVLAPQGPRADPGVRRVAERDDAAVRFVDLRAGRPGDAVDGHGFAARVEAAPAARARVGAVRDHDDLG